MQKSTSLSDERAVQDAFERVRRRSIGTEEKVLAEEGGALDDASFARAAGCSVSALLAQAATHQFFYVEHDGRRHWPKWQLGLPGLPKILATLAEQRAQGFSIADFFVIPTDVLYLSAADPRTIEVKQSDSPLTLLRRVGLPAVELVVQHARRFGVQGAR